MNNKEFKATQKYLLMGPRKIRLVVAVIKKMKPVEAIEKLPFVQKRAGMELSKVIRSAVAAAKAQGVSETDLIFKEIQIGEGPRLKRGKAVSRGMWHPFKRRMIHIRVVLTTRNSQIPNAKSQINSKVQNEKKLETGIQTENKVKTTKKTIKTKNAK